MYDYIETQALETEMGLSKSKIVDLKKEFKHLKREIIFRKEALR